MSVHTFHIPVMGTGFTIETPLRVARYGISSVVSIVDDMLVEQTRLRIARLHGRPATPIGRHEEDSRARRITAYLDLLHDLVAEQMDALRQSTFDKGSEIVRYFEMLPDSPLRALYERMREVTDETHRHELQEQLRALVRPGSIDVNIMTKLDRDRATGKIASGAKSSDAMAALRGFALSKLQSSVILSAGLNLRLFSYIGDFEDFLPDAAGHLRKKVILKVEDLRSALIQGRVLAKRGVWVSEFRIESGLNCGGHAFGNSGAVLGPILEEFQKGRAQLGHQLHEVLVNALEKAGRKPPPGELPFRVTVQGGIGTAEEDRVLRQVYGVDGTGWGSPFLLVPEVVSIDPQHLERVAVAREEDVVLSRNSPLGVPFWSLRTSASEENKRARAAEGRPGSPCPKGFLISNTEFHEKGLCTASRAYQKRKLAELEASDCEPAIRADAEETILAKACLCRDLAGGAEPKDERGQDVPTAVCCGPNTVYFSAVARLHEMVAHIYGRRRLPLAANRPHMFLKEMGLHVRRMREEVERRRAGLPSLSDLSLEECRRNLSAAAAHYRERAGEVAGDQRDLFLEQLEALVQEFQALTSTEPELVRTEG